MSEQSKGFIGEYSWRSVSTYGTTGATDANYPPANLKNDELRRVWRAVSNILANTKFYITLDKQRLVNGVVLANGKFSKPNAKVRVKLYTDAARTTLAADSGWKAWWDVVYAPDHPNAAWDSGNAWDRIYTDEDTAGRDIQKCIYFDDTLCRAIEVEIDDTANAVPVELGICDPIYGFYLPLNFEYGAQYGVQSRTTTIEASGGTEYALPNTPTDLFIGSTGMITHDDALGLMYEFLRRTDKHTMFWWSPDPTDKLNAIRHSFLAKNAEISLASYAVWQRDTVPMSFKRVL